jgi:signal peptidase I
MYMAKRHLRSLGVLIGSHRSASWQRRRLGAAVLAVVALAAVAFAGLGCGGSSHTTGPAAADVSGTTTAGASTTTTATAARSGKRRHDLRARPATGTAAGGASHTTTTSGTTTTTATDTTTSAHSDPASAEQPQSKFGSAVDPGKPKPKSKVKAGRSGAGAGSTGVGSATTVSSVSTSSSGSSGNAPNANTGVPFEVNTSSMEPTFQPETKVYYDPTRTTPQVGEVIIFHPPAGAKEGECGNDMTDGHACAEPVPGLLTNELSMKRVVGLPGDTIAIRGGRIIRNGQPESEPPITPCGEQEMVGCEFPNPITVPPGHYYVMSDYRGLYQEDSRIFGAIPQEAIVGTVEQP